MSEGIRVVLRLRDDTDHVVWLHGVPKRDEGLDLITDDNLHVQGIVKWVTWTNDGVLVEIR